MEDKQAEKLRKHYERLAARLSGHGLIMQGTITERTITQKNTQSSGVPKTLGPYYQWTFKRNAKTVTVNLSPEQVKPFQKAIDNNRKIEAIMAQLRELSYKILEASTKGVKRRKESK